MNKSKSQNIYGQFSLSNAMLQSAVNQDNEKSVELLLNSYTFSNNELKTAFHQAVRKKNIQIAWTLYQAGAQLYLRELNTSTLEWLVQSSSPWWDYALCELNYRDGVDAAHTSSLIKGSFHSFFR